METRIAELESNVTQFIRLMMFVCAIVLYGDVLAPVVRIARAGEVLPLQTAKLLLHCIWIWNMVRNERDA